MPAEHRQRILALVRGKDPEGWAHREGFGLWLSAVQALNGEPVGAADWVGMWFDSFTPAAALSAALLDGAPHTNCAPDATLIEDLLS